MPPALCYHVWHHGCYRQEQHKSARIHHCWQWGLVIGARPVAGVPPMIAELGNRSSTCGGSTSDERGVRCSSRSGCGQSLTCKTKPSCKVWLHFFKSMSDQNYVNCNSTSSCNCTSNVYIFLIVYRSYKFMIFKLFFQNKLRRR